MTNKTQKAKPVEMPKTTSKCDQVSATGYHDKEEGEETQDFRPNPLDNNTFQAINPLQDPIRSCPCRAAPGQLFIREG
jgi:hypothetical protein